MDLTDGDRRLDVLVYGMTQYGLLVLGGFCLDTVNYFMNSSLNLPLP